MASNLRRAVIITALPIERTAVLEHLRDVREEPHPRGSVYRRGVFDDNSDPWDILLAEIGAGNEGAAAETERVLAYFNPEAAVFVGVAGAIKDLTHGDVVASTKVYGYASGKDKARHFEPRPEVELPGYALRERARYEAGEPDWLRRIRPSGNSGNAGVVPSATRAEAHAEGLAYIHAWPLQARNQPCGLRIEESRWLFPALPPEPEGASDERP